MKLYACRECPCGCGKCQIMKATLVLVAGGGQDTTESEIREAARSSLKETVGAEYVWFEDESGTIYDPINGPIPQYGPRAEAAEMN